MSHATYDCLSLLRRVLAATLMVVALLGRCASAQESTDSFENWNLEPSVGQAHLILLARVSSVSNVTVVQGAKTDLSLREFRFQPVRRLKGLFQRDQLSMTATDLGISTEDAAAAPPLKEGDFRILILVQPQGTDVHRCVSAAPGMTTFDERVPRVTGPDDPLVAVIETLIRTADSRSRRERASLAVERLVDTDGISAVPLLTSLKSRADWAATDERVFASLARLSRYPSPAVRGAALELLRDVLATRIKPNDSRQLAGVAASLRELLESDEANTRVRSAAIGALGELLALNADMDWARELLIKQLTTAVTYAERSAAVTALSNGARPEAATAVFEALANLPFDELPARETVYARAAMRLDDAARPQGGAERTLLARLKRSIDARQSLEAEVIALGRMRSKESLPLLLAAAEQPNSLSNDRYYIAWALGRLGDDRAVPVLVSWLRRGEQAEVALQSLESIDSELAARELRPLLKTVASLPLKLRIARLLARHGITDGYALATEHLADVGQTPSATLVLAALNDPRTTNDLSAILAARPDRRWHAAALAGLATIGDAAARTQLREILNDERNPLAADAAEAAGLAADRELLLPLAKLAQSRNRQIALSSLVALRRFLNGVRTSPKGLSGLESVYVAANWGWANLITTNPGAADVAPQVADIAIDIPAETRAAISESVAALLIDTYVDAEVRQHALAIARLLRGERYAELLSALADQAELEGTPLLAEVQADRRRMRVAEQQP